MHPYCHEDCGTAGRSKKQCVGRAITGGSTDLAGVQCEACHGPGSEYKSLSIMKSREKSIAAGMVIPTEKGCVECHNQKSPNYKTFNFAEMVKKVHEVMKK